MKIFAFNIGKCNAEVIRLENLLGITQPTGTSKFRFFNAVKCSEEIYRLQDKCRAAGIDFNTPANVARVDEIFGPGTAAKILAPKPAATAVDVQTTAAFYLKLNTADRQQFCMDGGKLLRSEFETKLTAAAKTQFFQMGGKLTDPKPVAPPPISGNMATRAQFNALDSTAKINFFRNGGKLSDDTNL